MQHSLLLKNPFHLCPGWWGVSVCKCTCAFFKLSACYKPKNLSGAETLGAVNQRLINPTVLSPLSKFSVLQWKTSQESSCASYLVTSLKWNLRRKKTYPGKELDLWSEIGRFPRDHCCLGASSQDSWSFGYTNFIWRLTSIQLLTWTKALE